MTWVNTHTNSLVCIDQAHIFITDWVHGSVLSAHLAGGRELNITPAYAADEAVKIMAKLRERIVAGQVIIHMTELTSAKPLPGPFEPAEDEKDPNVRYTDQEFRMLLDLWMVSDPWPTEEWGNELMTAMLEAESKARGLGSVVDAFHLFKLDPTPAIIHDATIDAVVDTANAIVEEHIHCDACETGTNCISHPGPDRSRWPATTPGSTKIV